MMKETLSENGIQYSLHGDYYIPDLKLEPESPPSVVGAACTEII